MRGMIEWVRLSNLKKNLINRDFFKKLTIRKKGILLDGERQNNIKLHKDKYTLVECK